MLENVIHGLPLQDTVVLTGEGTSNDPIDAHCQELGVKCIRGSEENVFSRFHLAIQRFEKPLYVRLTGDNPCVYKDILPRMEAKFEDGDLDYLVSTELPLGGSIEMFTRESFLTQAKNQISPQQREHVTAEYYKDGSAFRWKKLRAGFSHLGRLRLTVDSPEDLRMMQILSKKAGSDPCYWDMEMLEKLYRAYPGVFEYNSKIVQKTVEDLA